MSRTLNMKCLSVVAVGLAFALMASTALAGGWAAVTLDELPTQLVAGQPLAIGFTVRQHGQTPLAGLVPTVIAVRVDTGEKVTATGLPEGEPGHYVASLTFPSAGTWEWVINDGFVTSDAFGIQGQPMPSLTVLASAPAAEAGASDTPPAQVSGAPVTLPLAVGIVGLVGAAGGLLALWRTRAPLAAALVLVTALISTTGFALATNGHSQPAASPGAPATSQAEFGRALFLAKGCVMCHNHEAVSDARASFADFRVGPDLSHFSAKPEYLRTWLKDPSAVKPKTVMPQLDLKDYEIEALVAFLSASAGP